MNYLWAFMILFGVIFAAFHGTLPEVTDAALDSAKEAVTLCITMTGVMAFWMGLMKIAEDGGMIAGLEQKLAPALRFLFPKIPENHPANRYIAANIIANIFGLGWAATPAGLKAMESLEELEEDRRRADAEEESFREQRRNRLRTTAENTRHRTPNSPHGVKTRVHAVPRGTANTEMCTFLIVNISSLQLIPVNIIAYRSQYGSADPTGILGAAILATTASTLAAAVFCKIMEAAGR